MRIRLWRMSTLCSVCLWLAWTQASAQEVPVRLGAEDDWAPFSSADNGTPEGMAVDIVRAIFAEAGLKLELVPLPYKRCLEETKQGKIAGCFDTLPDSQLRQDYRFHDRPLFSDPILILARSDHSALNLDMKGLESSKVLTTHGYTYGEAFETNPRIQRVVASHDINALRMLNAGRADYAVVYQRITHLLLRGEALPLAGKIKPVGQLTKADLYIAFSRQYPGIHSIVLRFNAAHERLLKGSTLQQIEKRWN